MIFDEVIGETFSKALECLIKKHPWGYQAKLARGVGIEPARITDIRKGRSHGSEEVRRAIAKTAGYEYEEFLDLGRDKDRLRLESLEYRELCHEIKIIFDSHDEEFISDIKRFTEFLLQKLKDKEKKLEKERKAKFSATSGDVNARKKQTV